MERDWDKSVLPPPWWLEREAHAIVEWWRRSKELGAALPEHVNDQITAAAAEALTRTTPAGISWNQEAAGEREAALAAYFFTAMIRVACAENQCPHVDAVMNATRPGILHAWPARGAVGCDRCMAAAIRAGQVAPRSSRPKGECCWCRGTRATRRRGATFEFVIAELDLCELCFRDYLAIFHPAHRE